MYCVDRGDFSVRRRAWCSLAAAVLAAGALTIGLAGTASAATPATTQTAAEAVTFWNGVAVNVIVVDAGKANAEAFLW
jgi:hypothetical protein